MLIVNNTVPRTHDISIKSHDSVELWYYRLVQRNSASQYTYLFLYWNLNECWKLTKNELFIDLNLVTNNLIKHKRANFCAKLLSSCVENFTKDFVSNIIVALKV